MVMMVKVMAMAVVTTMAMTSAYRNDMFDIMWQSWCVQDCVVSLVIFVTEVKFMNIT